MYSKTLLHIKLLNVLCTYHMFLHYLVIITVSILEQ